MTPLPDIVKEILFFLLFLHITLPHTKHCGAVWHVKICRYVDCILYEKLLMYFFCIFLFAKKNSRMFMQKEMKENNNTVHINFFILFAVLLLPSDIIIIYSHTLYVLLYILIYTHILIR